MKFLSVNYHLNSTYNVEDLALQQMLKNSVKNTKGISFEDSKINISHDSKSYSASLKIKLSKNTKLSIAMPVLQNNIEQGSLSLTGAKPINVEILMKEK